MNIFGLNISRGKGAVDILTRPQYTPTSSQGPLTPWFQDYYLRKVSGDFYEALREGIPIIDAAIRRLISLNGTVRIIGDNPDLVKLLEDFVLNVPVNDHQKGMHSFLENFSNEMFEQGFALPEFVATKKMDDIAELRVPDSKQIIFRRNALGKSEAWYRHFNGFTPNGAVNVSPQTLVDRIINAQYGQAVYLNSGWEEKLNPANKLYFSINNENTGPYGVSIMRSMEFCAKLLMTMQNSLGNVWERFGDPSYHVKYKTNRKDLGSDTLESRRLKIQEDFTTAISAKRSGKSADFVTALSAEADMDIKIIGSEGKELAMEIPVRHVLEQIVSKTNLPAWMLGVYWSTTERMATLEVEAALQDAKVRQLTMLPEIIRLFSIYHKLRGRTWKTITTSVDKPGDWGVVFDIPNIRDQVSLAQAEFLRAQAGQMRGAAEPVVVPAAKKSACGCGKDHFAGAGKVIHGAKESRPFPWPEIDRIESDYEARLKYDWAKLQAKVALITKVDVLKSVKEPDVFTFTIEQRAQVLQALKEMLGEYELSGDDSPVTWYYGQAYSEGLFQAANLVGEARPILDVLKDKEILDELTATGFELVKNNATNAILDKILPEMEAHMLAGSNPLSVAERLKKLFAEQNSNWERLVRTEMAMAAEKAKLAEWTAFGLTRVEFVTAPDACSICLALAGEYDIDKCPVPGRDTHPYDRCSIRPAASEA